MSRKNVIVCSYLYPQLDKPKMNVGVKGPSWLANNTMCLCGVKYCQANFESMGHPGI